jgi:protein-S-isoprenylcysteine O-methyltransferase Ste14
MRHVAYDVPNVGTWLCWGAFVLVWLAGAILARQRDPAAGRQGGRDLASTLGGFFGFAVVATPASLWRPLTVGLPWLRVVGLALLVLATAGAIWARVALGDMWATTARTTEHHALRTSGPYRIIRHPIYSAILGMVVATALTQGLGRWAALCVVVAYILALKIRAEERLLSSEFPDEYGRYRADVPQLIPGLRRRP